MSTNRETAIKTVLGILDRTELYDEDGLLKLWVDVPHDPYTLPDYSDSGAAAQIVDALFAAGLLEHNNANERDYQLAQIAELEDNWDGEGSLRPSPEVWRNAQSLLAFIPTDWNATAMDNGTILFESPNRTGPYNCIEVGTSKVAMILGNVDERLYLNGDITRPRVVSKGTETDNRQHNPTNTSRELQIESGAT